MFPSDTKNATVDDHSNESGILLAQTTYDRTALMGTIYCSGSKDNHLILGSILTQPNNNNLMDSEAIPRTQTFIYRKIPANTDVYYTKGLTNTSCFFTLLYTDYDLYLKSTSTPIVVVNSGGVSLTQGFTYGEVLIILVLLMIFTQAFFSELKQWFFGVRIENPMKNKYNKDL